MNLIILQVQLFSVVAINLGSCLQLNVPTVENVTKVTKVIRLRTLDHKRPFLEQSLKSYLPMWRPQNERMPINV